MAEVNLNPSFSDSVKSTLDTRNGWVETREEKWNYKRNAYFNLESVDGSGESKNDKETVFFIASKNNFGGSNAIGKSFSGGYLQAFYSDYDNNKNSLKPKFESATISVRGGESLYDTYVKEVTVNFTVFTINDLNRVEKSFFLPGAKAFVNYGWLGYTDENLNGREEIRIFNFGFTMNTDGSFSCNIKGLTPGFFASSQTATKTFPLDEDEKKALGDGAAESSTLPQAILAKALAAFGTTEEKASQRATRQLRNLIERKAKNGNSYYSAGITSSDVLTGIIFTEPQLNTYYYLKFETLIQEIQSIIAETNKLFVFDNGLTSISTVSFGGIDATKALGSADPRKYIFPNGMAYYGNDTFISEAPNELDIKNILISVSVIKFFYKEIFENTEESSKQVDEKINTVKTIKLLRALANDIKRLSGGLVNIEIIKSTADDNKYVIFNRVENEKELHPTPYEFSVLGESSIVKSVDLSSDFDVDAMLGLTIGSVKDGEVSLGPISKVYDDINPESIDYDNEDANNYNDKLTKLANGIMKTKFSIHEDGIDDQKAQSLADSYRTGFKLMNNDGNSGGTSPTLPFNLKLGITLDGVENIGFMQPITIDRIPDTYKQNDSIRFLVTGLEHTFDSNGGWDTKIETAMKIGKVQ
jgi:hypothetical protein